MDNEMVNLYTKQEKINDDKIKAEAMAEEEDNINTKIDTKIDYKLNYNKNCRSSWGSFNTYNDISDIDPTKCACINNKIKTGNCYKQKYELYNKVIEPLLKVLNLENVGDKIYFKRISSDKYEGHLQNGIKFIIIFKNNNTTYKNESKITFNIYIMANNIHTEYGPFDRDYREKF